MGSYRITLKKEGFNDVLYPIFIDRQRHWGGDELGGAPIALPRDGELEEDEVYIPAGWYMAGGDPLDPSDEFRRIWVRGFVIKKYQVTVGDFLVFLNDLVEQGRQEEALAAAPRERSGMDNAQGALLLGQSEEGRFFLQPDTDGDLWEEEWPVLMVDWRCILSYLQWYSQRTGHQWRLPFSLEWEKSARGVDGRVFSHGDFFDPSWCWTTDSHRSEHTPKSIYDERLDLSPYGVSGMMGNMGDWTASVFKEAQPQDGEIYEPIWSSDLLVERWFRGGYWSSDTAHCRLVYKQDNRSTLRSWGTSFRLARPFRSSENLVEENT